MLEFSIEFKDSNPVSLMCSGYEYRVPFETLRACCKKQIFPDKIRLKLEDKNGDLEKIMTLFTTGSVTLTPELLGLFRQLIDELNIDSLKEKLKRAETYFSKMPSEGSDIYKAVCDMCQQEESIFEFSSFLEVIAEIKCKTKSQAHMLAQHISSAIFSRPKNFNIYIELISRINNLKNNTNEFEYFMEWLPGVLYRCLCGRIRKSDSIPENVLYGVLLSCTQSYWDPLPKDEDTISYSPCTKVSLSDILFAISAIFYYGSFVNLKLLQDALEIFPRYPDFIPDFFCRLSEFVKDPSQYFVSHSMDDSPELSEPFYVDEFIQIILDDDVIKLQEKSSEVGFDPNGVISLPFWQIDIPECEFKQRVTYLECCALFGSEKCFRFLILNGSKMTKFMDIFSIAGGSDFIVHHCEIEKYTFSKSIETAIKYHRNYYVQWLLQNHPQYFDDKREISLIFDSSDFSLIANIIEDGLAHNIDYIFMNSVVFDIDPLINYLYEFNPSLPTKEDCNQTMYASIFNGNINSVKLISKIATKNKFDFFLVWSCLYTIPSFFESPIPNLNGNSHTFGGQFIQINGYDPLGIAAFTGQFEIFKLIVESNIQSIDMSTRYFEGSMGVYTNIVGVAIQGGSMEILDYIIENTDFDYNYVGKEIEIDFEPYLNVAVRYDNIKVIQKILNNGGNVEIQNTATKEFPLIIAAQYGKINALKELLKCPNINVNKEIDNENVTALYKAVCFNQEEVVKLLLMKNDIRINGFLIDKTRVSENIVKIFRDYLANNPNKSCSFI